MKKKHLQQLQLKPLLSAYNHNGHRLVDLRQSAASVQRAQAIGVIHSIEAELQDRD